MGARDAAGRAVGGSESSWNVACLAAPRDRPEGGGSAASEPLRREVRWLPAIVAGSPPPPKRRAVC